MIEAGQLLLDRLHHGDLDRLGRRAGIVGDDGDRGRRDRRILGDRQVQSASTPATIITMAMTVAKIGRSMKKRAMRLPRRLECASACGERGLGAIGGAVVRGDLLSHDHLHSGFDPLQTRHDETVACGEALRDDPLVTERAIELDAALLDHIVCAHDDRRGGAIRARG